MGGDPPHHHGRLGLRPLWLPPPRLRRLPREHQVFELLQICRAAAPILVLSGTDQNLPSGKKTHKENNHFQVCNFNNKSAAPFIYRVQEEKKAQIGISEREALPKHSAIKSDFSCGNVL